ncbi:hypothetical protein BD779DRAFT_1671002 [Infundibulicybe gibba]|nr:hypothetical protein BD779DRAFT_1671002 [Infundibulicybe gibba]
MTFQESTSEHTLERYFLASNLISAIGYGTAGITLQNYNGATWIPLYVACTIYLWRKRKARSIFAFLLVYMTLLFTLSNVMLIAEAHRVELTFVDNQNFPGGPLGRRAGVIVLVRAVYYLALLGGVVLRWATYGIPDYYLSLLHATCRPNNWSHLPRLHRTLDLTVCAPRGTHDVAWGLAYYTLIIGTNIVLTVLILTRLIAHRRGLPRAHGRTYTSLITMLIESSAAYSVIGTVCLVTYGVDSPVYSPFVSACITVQQITGYLITARFAHGRAWQTDTTTHDGAERPDILSSANDGYTSGSKLTFYIKPERTVEYA